MLLNHAVVPTNVWIVLVLRYDFVVYRRVGGRQRDGLALLGDGQRAVIVQLPAVRGRAGRRRPVEIGYVGEQLYRECGNRNRLHVGLPAKIIRYVGRAVDKETQLTRFRVGGRLRDARGLFVVHHTVGVKIVEHLVVGRGHFQKVRRLGPPGCKARLPVQKYAAGPYLHGVPGHCHAAFDEVGAQVGWVLLFMRHMKHHDVVALDAAEAREAERRQLNQVRVAFQVENRVRLVRQRDLQGRLGRDGAVVQPAHKQVVPYQQRVLHARRGNMVRLDCRPPNERGYHNRKNERVTPFTHFALGH